MITTFGRFFILIRLRVVCAMVSDLDESHSGLPSRDSHARAYLAGLNTGPNEGVSDKVFCAASVMII